MSRQPDCQRYIDEIRVWQKASQLHARKAIEQYQRVTANLEAFHHERRRYEAILDGLAEGVMVTDEQGEIILWNQAMARLFNLSAPQALEQLAELLLEVLSPDLAELVYAHRHDQPERRSHHVEIGQRTFLAKLSRVEVEARFYDVLLLEDITHEVHLTELLRKERDQLEQRVAERTERLREQMRQREQAQQELEQMVRTDRLTGLLNRHGFQLALERALERARQDETPYALLFIDLDGFKAINDALGHHAGDQLLQAVAQRIRRLIRQRDDAARMGGDEFAVILYGVNDEQVVCRIARALVEALSDPVTLPDQQTARVSASVGVYLHMPGEYDVSRVLSMADHAMYEAKRRGKRRFVLFEEDMWAQLEDTRMLGVALEKALEADAFEIFLQPICTVDGEIVGAEALARWQHEGEWISPAVFIPLLEKRGLIQAFTYRVIDRVVALLRRHRQLPCISVNLSLQQFFEEHFVEHVRRNVDLCGCEAALGFEVTESVLHSDMKRVSQQLDQLRQLGFRISLDDFGTGYSSFAYIRDLPADVLKIDRAFVRRITEDERDRRLLFGMISLARELGLRVVIEGVETASQLALIREHVGDYPLIQGFVFHRPMPVEALLQRL